MSFYEELSQVYDIVFPEDNQTTDFLCRKLKENSMVLDLACGTGSYSLAIEARGHNVIGIDLDESMIKLAKNKDRNRNVNFYTADMLQLNQVLPKIEFNLIYCIGNSLVHLKDKKQIQLFISQAYEKLNKKGDFIIQIINYDRIFKNDIKGLPTIDRGNKGIKFVRNYNFNKADEKMYFDTELIINKNGSEEKYQNSVPLLPIKSSELLDIINSMNFSDVQTYGDFSDEKFTDESYVLVIRATK